MSREINLKDKAKIAVIGGGPAGSFFAHFARKWATKKGLEVSLTIFDGKDFLLRGPKGCNLCAGVISESLNRKLKEEGIFLPERRIISRVDGYCLHAKGESLALNYSENETNPVSTVFRGNGPRYSTFPEIISFDDFLLSYAQDCGAKVIPFPVWDIRLPQNPEKPISLVYGEKNHPQIYEADLVVGAFGVNTHFIKKMGRLGFGYRPPQTLTSFQAEMKLGRDHISEHFRNMIHVYMLQSNTIRYATVIPKGDYLTITLIGRKNICPGILSEFLSLKEIRDKIPDCRPHCFCYPKIVVSPAKNPFHDRLVMIGDSSFSRHYKNGLESAFLTARSAAETVFLRGIDEKAFRGYYFNQAKKLIIRDNAYGRLLFAFNDFISSSSLLTRAHLSLASNNAAASKKIKFILWNMFTGNIPYRHIFRVPLDLNFQIALLMNTVRSIFQEVKKILSKTRKKAARSSDDISFQK